MIYLLIHWLIPLFGWGCCWSSLLNIEYWILQSLYSSVLEFLFGFWIVFVFLLNFSFCLYIGFLILFCCLFVYSCSFLNFLKRTNQISVPLGAVIRALLVSFDSVMFTWFFMILDSLCCCLHTWVSSAIFRTSHNHFHRGSPLPGSSTWGSGLVT